MDLRCVKKGLVAFVFLVFAWQGRAQVVLDLRPLEIELHALRTANARLVQSFPSQPGLKWLFTPPKAVFSPFLPDYLRPNWSALRPRQLFDDLRSDPNAEKRIAAVLDSLKQRRGEIERFLSDRLRTTLWRSLTVPVKCYVVYVPGGNVRAAGYGRSVVVSIAHRVSLELPPRVDVEGFEADALKAVYTFLDEDLLVSGDLLLEVTGNHAAVREDLISRYGFGWVSLASRVLGRQRHHRDPDLLREIVDRWGKVTTIDPHQASKAAEFFRELARQGMAAWSAAPALGIPDSALYLFQMHGALSNLDQQSRRFHRAFDLVVVQNVVNASGPIQELTDMGVFEDLGLYMANRIEKVFGRDRLLRSFSKNEVEFFLDYVSCQEEADLKFDDAVCEWGLNLANELDRLVKLADQL